ncbi:hypothetical protein, partial [Nostoc edaphicum]|uniref:hypothetical protein n=1 Tax=Nostoc edaphicum TaxID=264686 RepID=UPI001D14EAF1
MRSSALKKINIFKRIGASLRDATRTPSRRVGARSKRKGAQRFAKFYSLRKYLEVRFMQHLRQLLEIENSE